MMKNGLSILLLLLSISLSAQQVALSGYIRDGKTNEAIADATVRLYLGNEIGEISTQTKEDGYYEIKVDKKLSDRNYAVLIQKQGYQRVNGVIKLNFGNEPLRNYKLYPANIPEATVDGPSLIVGAPANNLTFLIDVSGSMEEENRLENLKASLLYLLKQFRPEDKLSIITYSTTAQVLLNNASISESDKIEEIIKGLEAGGSSKGSSGLKKAYDLAMVNYQNAGNNKIILSTDGFFGEDKRSQKFIQELIKKGLIQDIKLSIFSFGRKDKNTEDRLKNWCSLGDGNYTNVTSLEKAKSQIIQEAKGE